MASNGHVLVVDDDPITLALAESKLTQAGYRVTTAANGLIARSMLGANKFDLALVDLEMPKMNGFEFLRTLQERNTRRDVFGIVISGRRDAEAITEAYASGALGYITKPINWHILIHQVRQVLQTRCILKKLRKAREKPSVAAAIGEKDRSPPSHHSPHTALPTSSAVAATSVPFVSIIDAAVVEARDQVRGKSVRIQRTLPHVAYCSPGRTILLTDAVSTLIERAIRVTPEHGLVEVRVDGLRCGNVFISIDDEGPFVENIGDVKLKDCADVNAQQAASLHCLTSTALRRASNSIRLTSGDLSFSSHRKFGSSATLIVSNLLN